MSAHTAHIKETSELFRSVASIVHDWMEADKDGKVSVLEIGQLVLGNLAKTIAGLKGFAKIPGELLYIANNPDALDELYFVTMGELQWPEHSTPRDIFNAIFNTIFHLVNNIGIIRNTLNPIVARVVPESLPGNEDPP